VSEAVLIAPEPPRRAAWLWGFVGFSLAVHAAVLAWLTVTPVPATPQKRVTELVMIEVERPPPPPVPEARPEPEKPIPPEVRKLFKPKLDPRLLVQPPPNDQAPEEKPAEPPPVVVGLTLRSTTTAGSFDAPVGNTLAGKPPDKAVDPATVKPSPVPLYELDSRRRRAHPLSGGRTESRHRGNGGALGAGGRDRPRPNGEGALRSGRRA
jgi:periplasmic protein TonB